MSTDEIPFFEDQTNRVIPGQPVIERDVATCVLYNPKTDEVLCLKWGSFDWKTLINGGIDEGEDAITAAKREICEETGYKDIRFLADLGKVRSSFYAANKKENRIANSTGLIFELITNERVDIDASELAKHISEWVHKDKVASYINIDWQLYLWEKALNSGLLKKI